MREEKRKKRTRQTDVNIQKIAINVRQCNTVQVKSLSKATASREESDSKQPARSLTLLPNQQ